VTLLIATLGIGIVFIAYLWGWTKHREDDRKQEQPV